MPLTQYEEALERMDYWSQYLVVAQARLKAAEAHVAFAQARLRHANRTRELEYEAARDAAKE